MNIIFSLILGICLALFSGYLTKEINESKGYNGGFLLGALLPAIGLLVVSCKKDQPNADPNGFKAVPLQNVLKKFHYPFISPKVEPIDILKGNIYAEGEAAKTQLVFYIFHGLFMFTWYCLVISIYLWYLIIYSIRWFLTRKKHN